MSDIFYIKEVLKIFIRNSVNFQILCKFNLRFVNNLYHPINSNVCNSQRKADTRIGKFHRDSTGGIRKRRRIRLSAKARRRGKGYRDIVNRLYGNRPRSPRQPDISECFTPH